ncbi:hypothetical protein CC80DRAFT_85038 [Byssothecium circinans]|uniref:Uncharacterized protein n=1 Tax=Byssothecium circinans TaxID=147558 RepID=A0A6A5TXN6_9PLEO|nr:hypothetical protein CC80DRAFT_85038 [Byssothecium circinans]
MHLLRYGLISISVRCMGIGGRAVCGVDENVSSNVNPTSNDDPPPHFDHLSSKYIHLRCVHGQHQRILQKMQAASTASLCSLRLPVPSRLTGSSARCYMKLMYSSDLTSGEIPPRSTEAYEREIQVDDGAISKGCLISERWDRIAGSNTYSTTVEYQYQGHLLKLSGYVIQLEGESPRLEAYQYN